MDGRQVSDALRSGRRVYATLIASLSPNWPKFVRPIGLDAVFIDTEHAPVGRETVAWMCNTYRGMGLAPLVRIPGPDPQLARMVLDGGAAGVIVPYVECREEVLALVGAVKLLPLKGRRMEDSLTGRAELEPELSGYLDGHNAGNVLIVMAESTPAVEALEDMVSVPGVDGVMIGPHDLSCSLGIPEQYDHPLFEETVQTIIRTSRAAGVGVGVHYWGDTLREVSWAQAGANLIMHSGDCMVFRDVMRADIAQIREALGDEGGPSTGEEAVI